MPVEKFEVIRSALNVRNEPSLHGKVVEILAEGAVVKRIDVSGDQYWFKIETTSGVTGWASHKYLEKVTAAVAGEPVWMAIARAEKGTREFPGAADNPRIVEYLHSTNLGAPYQNEDETHWCSAFVNWCMERAGYEGTDSAWARSWLNWGKKITTPVAGCIAVFERGQGGHVAFYVSHTATAVRVLGGNQSDEVNESNYKKSNLLGYRMPA